MSLLKSTLRQSYFRNWLGTSLETLTLLWSLKDVQPRPMTEKYRGPTGQQRQRVGVLPYGRCTRRKIGSFKDFSLMSIHDIVSFL